MQLIDGKKTSLEIQQEIAKKVKAIKDQGDRPPHLAAILVGEDGASHTYVNAKVKACKKVGFDSSLFKFDASISEADLLATIKRLNVDDGIDGILVQLPLPEEINVPKVIQTIVPEKDVDGFHPVNMGRMIKNLPAYVPATPKGIVELLKRYNIETAGKYCVIIGRSDIVGRPMSILMSNSNDPGNCTVTLCHSRTKNIEKYTREADIIIVALGKAEFLKADMVKEGVVVIDVGITRVQDASKKRGYSLKGDVAFEEVSKKASYITPVPGGVGPMTIASLLMNTLASNRKEWT